MSEEAAQNRKSNPRAAQVRIQSAKASSYAGQRKHDLRKGAQPSYVDAAKAEDNETLIEPPTPGELRKINEARRSLRTTYRAMRSDAAVAFVGILTFGAEAQTVFEALKPKKQAEAFEDAARAVAERLNTTLAGLVIHRDESAIHGHFVLPSYDLDGNPLTGTVKRQTLKDLQDVVAEAFQKHAPTIERGRSVSERLEAGATRAETIHKTVRQLHADLPADLAAKEAEVAAAALRVEEMRARVEKLEAKAELTDKEAKRLETYQARLADRVAEQEAAQAEAERLAQVARDDAAQAELDRDQARAEEEQARILAAEAEARRVEAEEDALRVSTKAEALLTATAALTAEMTAGTLRRTPEGRIKVQNLEAIRGGLPDLAPTLRAATDAMEARRREEQAAEAAKAERVRAEAEADGARAQAAQIAQQAEADREAATADREAAAADRQEAATMKAEILTLRGRMLGLLKLLKAGLKRVGDHLPKAQRDEVESAIEQATDLITPTPTDPEAKKSGKDTGRDFRM